MKEKPILFSAPMVRAILAGTKTQTRRMFSLPRALSSCCESPNRLHVPHNGADSVLGQCYMRVDHCEACDSMGARILCPYGNAGDRLWVRETFCLANTEASGPGDCIFAADDNHGVEDISEAVWTPSIHMPRRASRITLEITGVRVERVQDIGKDGRKAKDVLAEGITSEQIEHWRKWLHPDDAPAHTYSVLWNTINGKDSWAQNPWVWVIEFKRI